MAGEIGRRRTSSGPDLAVAGSNEQVASFTPKRTDNNRYILYQAGTWAGIYSGSPRGRIALFWEASDSSSPGGYRPGGVAVQSEEFSVSTGYTGGGGGQSVTVDLEEPFLTTAKYNYAVAVASRSGQLGFAMYQASAISETNEYFYRKGISETTFEDANGSSKSNQGQIVAWFNGELSVKPNLPGSGVRSGSATKPTIKSTFSDPNQTLPNGMSWDYLNAYRIEIWWGGVRRWNPGTMSASTTERNGSYSSRQIGVTVPYDTVITYRVQHQDRAGLWSDWRENTFSIPNPNALPYAPTNVGPSGTQTNGSLKPSLQMRHRDPDGNSSTHVQMQVRRASDQVLMLNKSWAVSVANNGLASRTYDGTGLKYYTDYQFRGRTRDAEGWGPYSGWTTFRINHVNHAPAAPSIPTPVGTLAVGSKTVETESLFSDSDITLPDGTSWDYLYQYEITLRQKSNNQVKFGPTVYNASTAERNAKKATRSITVPDYDVDYNLSIRHRDRNGTWGSSKTVTFKLISGVSVERPTAPTGRINNLDNPGNVVVRYRSTTGTSANGFQAILRTSSGSTVDTSTLIAKTVAPDATVTLTWAELGFPSLVPGTDYTVEVRARDTSSRYSPYSQRLTLVTDHAPRAITPYSPLSGYASDSLPEIQFQATDPDDPASSLVGVVRIVTESGTPIGSPFTLLYDSGTGRIRGSIPAGIITSHGVYGWQGAGFDGYLYTGGSKTVAGATWSAPQTFIYDEVPSVTMTGPASPISTTNPVIEWTVDDQQRYQVQMFNEDGGLVYDTGIVTSTVPEHTVVSDANWIGGEKWNRDEKFTVVVRASDSTTIWGEATPVDLLLSYEPPTSLYVTATAMTMPNTSGTNYVYLEHDQTTFSSDEFLGYVWDRVEISGPGGSEIPGTMIRNYARNNDAGDPTLIDANVKSGHWYRYFVWQEVRAGFDIIEGQPMIAEQTVSWRGAIIHLPYSPLNFCCHLEYSAPGSPYSEESTWEGGMSSVARLSGAKPIGVNSPGVHRTKSGEYGFADDGILTANQRRDQLHNVWINQFKNHSPDGRPHMVCWRDGRGGPDGVIYGQLESPVIRHSRGFAFAVTLRLSEREYIIGEGE